MLHTEDVKVDKKDLIRHDVFFGPDKCHLLYASFTHFWGILGVFGIDALFNATKRLRFDVRHPNGGLRSQFIYALIEHVHVEKAEQGAKLHEIC